MNHDAMEHLLVFCLAGNVLFFLALSALAGAMKRMREEINFLREAHTRHLEEDVALWKRMKDLAENQNQLLGLLRSRR